MSSETSEVNQPERPPKTLLASIILLWLAGLLAFGEWLLDRTNLNSTLATLQHPTVLFPPDVEVFDADGNPLTGLDRNSLWDAAEKSSSARARAKTIRQTVVVCIVATMAVAAFTCGIFAWSKTHGKWYSPTLAGMATVGVWAFFLTCVALMLTMSFYKLISRSSDMGGNTGHAVGRYIISGLFVAGFCLLAWWKMLPHYRILRAPKEGVSETRMPMGWKTALTAVPVLSIAALVIFFVWLNGVNKDQEAAQTAQKKNDGCHGCSGPRGNDQVRKGEIHEPRGSGGAPLLQIRAAFGTRTHAGGGDHSALPRPLIEVPARADADAVKWSETTIFPRAVARAFASRQRRGITESFLNSNLTLEC